MVFKIITLKFKKLKSNSKKLIETAMGVNVNAQIEKENEYIKAVNKYFIKLELVLINLTK